MDGVKTGERNVNIDYPVLQLFSLYEKRAGGWTGIWLPKPYPNTFDIDYVRVYKLVPGGQALPKEQLAIAEVEAQEAAENTEPEAAPAEDEKLEEEPIQLRGETKTCPVCKAEVDGDALFCNHCGAQL